MEKTEIRREIVAVNDTALQLLEQDLRTRAYKTLGLVPPGTKLSNLVDIDKAMGAELDLTLADLNIPRLNEKDVEEFMRDKKRETEKLANSGITPKLRARLQMGSLALLVVSLIGSLTTLVVTTYSDSALWSTMMFAGVYLSMVSFALLNPARFEWKAYPLKTYPADENPSGFTEQMIQIAERLPRVQFFITKLERTSDPVITAKYGESRYIGVFDETDFPPN